MGRLRWACALSPHRPRMLRYRTDHLIRMIEREQNPEMARNANKVRHHRLYPR